MKKYFTLCLLLSIVSTLSAQWRIVDSENNKNSLYQSRQLAEESLQNDYSRLIAAGYLDAQIDTTIIDSAIHVSVIQGKFYSLSKVNWENEIPGMFSLNDEIYRRTKALDFGFVYSQIQKAISLYENKGFPFASVELREVKEEDGKTEITLRMKPGPEVLIDSLVIRSENKLPQKYIRNYLDLRKGEYYNESKLKGLDKKLKEIPFVQLKSTTELLFKPGKADVYLFLQKKKANYFNGIIGVRPDDITGKINITGDAEIKLINSFNSGESFYINWRKLQSQTQDLNVETTIPYLFSTPLGISGQLKIYKRDSSYTNLKANGGIVFAFSGNNNLRAFIERNTSSQLTTYSSALPLANTNSTLYGLSAHFERLDYRFNPRKGYQLDAQFASGFRNVNQRLQNVEAAHNGRYNLHRIETEVEYFIPTFKRQTIRIGAQGSALFTQVIFDNEMYRIGGLRSIRGIDEESIYASSWAMGNVEYRFLFEENAALYVFFDQAWYEKSGVSGFVTDMPIGFGAGVNFETNAGIFTFNYALGKQFDNPIKLRNAKISFGFRSIF